MKNRMLPRPNAFNALVSGKQAPLCLLPNSFPIHFLFAFCIACENQSLLGAAAGR